MVNTMENAEEVMQVLDRFTRLKQKEIPKELDDYLQYVAKTGDTVFKWSSLKYLFREKLLNVIKAFHDNSPRVDEIPQYPNVDPFNYESMKSSLLERLELFNAAPFTIQRLCELLIDPRKQYSRIDKFMRALEKNILVVSTVEPGRKRTESENGDSLDSVVNGDLSLDVNVDIDMVENESIFSTETQNGNGAVPAAVASVAAIVAATTTTAADNLVENKEKLSVVSTSIISDVGTNAVRSGDDDILPHPKKAKLELHDNNTEIKATENNGEQTTKPVEEAAVVVAIAKITDANGSKADLDVKEKHDADKIVTKEEVKKAEGEKNGNISIEDKGNTSKATIVIEDAKENDVEMAEEKIAAEQIKITEKIEESIVDKIMPEKTEKMEDSLEQVSMLKDNVVDEKIIQETANEKTKDKDKALDVDEEKEKSIVEYKNIKNAAIKEKGDAEEEVEKGKQAEVLTKSLEKVPQKDIEIVVQEKIDNAEKDKENTEKVMVIEVLVENKDNKEKIEKKDEILSKKPEEKEQNINVEAITIEKNGIAIAVETTATTVATAAEAVVEEKHDNILEAISSKFDAEEISSKATGELTAKIIVETAEALPKEIIEKEQDKSTVQENNASAIAEEPVNMTNVENKTLVVNEAIPAAVITEKATEAAPAPALAPEPAAVVVVVVKPTEAAKEEEKIIFTSNAKASTEVEVLPTPPAVTAIETSIVEVTTAADVKPIAEDKTEKPSDIDTVLANENNAAKAIESAVAPQPSTVTTIDPISPVPLISAGVKDDTLELTAVAAEADIINSTGVSAVVVAATTATPLLETVAIITEPTLTTTNDIIAPTLTLNDQPMEDLPMDETVPEEVIMTETVSASIGSVLGSGSGLIEMATDAMEASSKDEPPVDGMDVDDNSQEAMDQ